MARKGKLCMHCGQVNSLLESTCKYCNFDDGLIGAEIQEYFENDFKLKKGSYKAPPEKVAQLQKVSAAPPNKQW